MTLRDLVLKMHPLEKLMVKYPPNMVWVECTPDLIFNEYVAIRDLHVETIWYSPLYSAIMIEVE